MHNVLERLRVRDVVHKDAEISSSVKLVAQALESLLASSVPDLHDAQLVVHQDFLAAEVRSNRRLHVLSKLGPLEHLDQTSFAHT